MRRPRPLLAERILLVSILSLSTACASSFEKRARGRLGASDFWPEREPAREADEPPNLDGSLAGYLAEAMRDHPELEAAYETWRAKVHAIARTRRLPDPTFSYGYFVRNVETRVGPQRHKFSVRQMLPWPSKLRAGANAAAGHADAAERAFEARVLALRYRIANAYWKLWLVRRTQVIHVDHKQLLNDLAESVRTRIAIGRASLADVSQIDLRVTRMDDAIDGLSEKIATNRAALLAAASAPGDAKAPTNEPAPSPAAPATDEQTLRTAAYAHPRVRRLDFMADASDDRATRADKEGLPSFVLGFDYIETGPAAVDMPDSGKDPMIVSLGVSIPLWRSSYRSEGDKARAEAASFRAASEAAKLRVEAELQDALSHVRDSARRIHLYQKTLIPQADGVYEAVVGAYQTGDATLAALLLAQADVLELRIQLAEAHANHGRAWAHLEHVVGREVAAQESAHE
jgi:outer membrane protein TolC